MNTKLLTLLFFLWASYACAQDSSTVRLLIKGVSEGYFIAIDGKLKESQSEFKLAQGTHDLQVWSPRYDLYRGTIETGKTTSTTKMVELQTSDSYRIFLAQREDYKRRVFFMRTAPVLVGAISMAALPALHIARLNKHEALVKSRFFSGLGQVGQEATNHVAAQYHTVNALFFTALAGAVCGTGAFFLFHKKVKSLTPPVFRQQNPFTLEYIELTMNGPVATGGLTFSF